MDTVFYVYDEEVDEILSFISNEDSIDHWSCVELIANDSYGLTYNYCVEFCDDNVVENCSAFYPISKGDDGYWHEDFSNAFSYHIDFSEPDWKVKAEEFARNTLKNISKATIGG